MRLSLGCKKSVMHEVDLSISRVAQFMLLYDAILSVLSFLPWGQRVATKI